MTLDEAQGLSKDAEIFDIDTGEVYRVENVFSFAGDTIVYVAGTSSVGQYSIFTNKMIARLD